MATKQIKHITFSRLANAFHVQFFSNIKADIEILEEANDNYEKAYGGSNASDEEMSDEEEITSDEMISDEMINPEDVNS